MEGKGMKQPVRLPGGYGDISPQKWEELRDQKISATFPCGESRDTTYAEWKSAWDEWAASVGAAVENGRRLLKIVHPWRGLARAVLPHGKKLRLPYAQWRAVWEIWTRAAPRAVKEGVEVAEGEDRLLVVASIYSPLWEALIVYIAPDGEVSDCSEQCCQLLTAL